MFDTLDTLMLMAFGLAILSILLGFVALLTQRIYLDANTQKPVDIDVPLLGKMKTNYPALVFVFLGFFFAYIVLEKQPKEKKEIEWDINGAFTDPKINDWQAGGKLILFPTKITPNVDKNGKFTISMKIEEGKSFEDMIEKIEYSHNDGEVTIYPRDEYSAYVKGDTCKLEKAVSHIRTYKPVPLQRTGEK